MIIIVEYENEVLGSGEFWRGPPSKIGEIRNIVARDLAAAVAVDGARRNSACGL